MSGTKEKGTETKGMGELPLQLHILHVNMG